MKPIEGIRIVDLSRLLPGPYCTRLLCDMGAEVIKVEEPERGDYLRSLPPFENGVSVAFEMLNHGKKSITLNLETSQGQAILSKLVSKADVFIETFQPGTAEKLGCDFDSVRQVNPRIIYCSLTAYGQTGPYRDMAGHDINFIGLSGFLSLNGAPEPTVPSLQVGDLAGGMLAALSITTSLFARNRVNHAQYIDMGILDALLSWLTIPMALRREEYSMMLGGAAAFYRIYHTADSKMLTVGAIEPKFWEELCTLIGRPDLARDQFSAEPRRTEVIKAVESAFAQKTRDEWFRIMLERGIPCASVLSLEEVIKDPQARSREMILKSGSTKAANVYYLGNPCKISYLGPPNISHSPALGENSTELLKSIGYSESAIHDFEQAGII